MRYVETVLEAGQEGVHPIDVFFDQEDRIKRVMVHNINLLNDGTAVALSELTGDVEVLEALAEETDVIIDYHTTVRNDRITVYTHFEPRETIRELLSLVREHQLILDYPLEYTKQGNLRSLVVGTDETFREVLDRIPDEVDIRLERTGEYEPETERLYSLLTERQQETLETALEIGYYEEPRQATHKDIARELDLSDGTVGEHLRKIEERIFSSIVPQ